MSKVFEYEITAISLKVKYIIHKHHRNGHPKKSQWTLSEDQEFECFKYADDLTYICSNATDQISWGLHLERNKASYLGKAAANAPNAYQLLFIAKFVRSPKGVLWHGYPANSVANDQDMPPPEVLRGWERSGYISLKTVRKLSQKKKCTL